ncbi:MAG: archaeal heat shock protein Hsp20 [Candidatus Odinarchaeia archaeon]
MYWLSWDDFFDWFKRKRRSYFDEEGEFDDFREFFRNIEELMMRDLRELWEKPPENLVREKKLPDGRIVKELGPFVYGYSVKIGPDGKPEIQEFGNFKPGLEPVGFGSFKPRFDVGVKEVREPLIDILEEDNKITVVAELPGVEKKDINLNVSGDILTIKVDTDKHKYFKEIKLPVKVNPETAQASYRNGVLEVILEKEETEKGKSIKVE